MKTKITLFAILLTITTTFAQKQWSLKDCVDYALKNNITIHQNKLNVDVAKATLKETKGSFLPNLNASTGGRLSFNPIIEGIGRSGTSSSFSGDFGITSGVTLYAGGKNKNNLKQASLNLENNKLKVQEIQNDIALQVVNAYLNILFAKENLTVAKMQLEISKEQEKITIDKLKIGTVPKTDLLNVKSTVANDIQNIVTQQNILSINLLQLAQLLQISSENFDVLPIDIETPTVALLYKNSKNIYEKALSFRPEIEGAKINIENSKLAVDIAKSAYLPSISASANVGANYLYGLGDSNNKANYSLARQLNNTFAYGVGFNVNIPIFNGYKTDASVTQAKIQKNISEIALENKKLQLQQTIEKVYLDAKLAAQTYEATQISLNAQKEAFKNAKTSYNYGSMTQFDFDQVRSRLVNTKGAMIRAKYDYIFKTKVLKFYLGENIVD